MGVRYLNAPFALRVWLEPLYHLCLSILRRDDTRQPDKVDQVLKERTQSCPSLGRQINSGHEVQFDFRVRKEMAAQGASANWDAETGRRRRAQSVDVLEFGRERRNLTIYTKTILTDAWADGSEKPIPMGRSRPENVEVAQ